MAQHPNPYVRQPSVTYLQNYRTPYQLCPVCGETPLRWVNLPFLTCAARHQFYECPTCRDTRVTEQRENIRYCGLFHPYHICEVHQVPVVGTTRVGGRRCTCPAPPAPTTADTDWFGSSPFV